jgi:hypothetical protein
LDRLGSRSDTIVAAFAICLASVTGQRWARVEILGFAGDLMFFDPDFTNMDPDPVEHRSANLNRERPKPSLDQ